MWNLTNKTKKQNRNRFIDKENRLTAVSGAGVWGLGQKGEGIKQKEKEKTLW